MIEKNYIVIKNSKFKHKVPNARDCKSLTT